MHKLLIIIIALFVMSSCKPEKQAAVNDGKVAVEESQPSVSGIAPYSLEITPKNPVRSSTLSLIPAGFELSGVSVEWFVNNRPFEGSAGHQLRSAELEKGDTIQARALVKGYEIRSDQITIMNSPPRIAGVDVIPEEFESRVSLRVEASGQDIDGDQVTFLYEWIKNGTPAGNGNRIEGLLKRGDAVTVSITPFDGTDYGPATIIRREIGNLRPVITTHKEFSFDGNTYIYQVKAEDADGDTLVYSLRSAPAEMTINPGTGLIKWNVPRDFKGAKTVTIAVNDGHGESAEFTLNITIGPVP